jgi:hypothetical protein
MIREHLILAFTIMTGLVAQQPPATPIQAETKKIPGSREIIPVADDAKTLQEETLPRDSMSNAGPDNQTSASSAPVLTKTESASGGAGGDGSGRVTLDFNLSPTNDSFSRGTAGLRLYRFTLKPKEKVDFRLQRVPPGKFIFSFGLPNQADAKDDMFMKLRAANRLPRDVRNSRISLANSTDKPYEFVLRMSGPIDIPYTLLIDRK